MPAWTQPLPFLFESGRMLLFLLRISQMMRMLMFLPAVALGAMAPILA